MLNNTSESVYINNRDLISVFKIIKDIDKYPDIFKFYKATNLISDSKNKRVFEITATLKRGVFCVGKGEIFSWRSEICLDSYNSKLFVNELNPKRPLKILRSNWILSENNAKIKVTINHQFEIFFVPLINPLIKYVVRKIIIKNSRLILNSLKSYIENML